MLIKLTDTDGMPFYVSPTEIICIGSTRNNSVITLSNGVAYPVKETTDEILDLMKLDSSITVHSAH